MYLYDKLEDNIFIYDMKIDKLGLIEYKKKHLNDIKSIILHVKDKKTEDFLFWNDRIFFDELDKRDEDTNEIINYIELTNKKEVIDKYINGFYDKYSPIYIKCDDFRELSLKSDIINDDYILLFDGGVRTNTEFISSDSILLSGNLSYHQQLIKGDLHKIEYIDSYLIDDEFINIIKCDLIKEFNYNDLKIARELGLLTLNDIDNKLDKSYELLKLVRK